jgi:putative transposase
MAKRDLEKIIGRIEDATTDVEEAREERNDIRRKCLDHVIVVNDAGLSRILTRYVTYYHQSRTHLSLARDSPQPRPIAPPELGSIVAIPQVGGLHHRYERRAA